MSRECDVLVVGAGYAGAVAARELAERGGKRVLIIEKRNHVGGNCFDCLDAAGVLIHRYGPHIFHTSDKRVYDYLSRFTDWLEYEHCVVADVYGKIVPVPFNLNSLRVAFGEEKATRLETKLVKRYGMEAKVPILELRKAEDPEIVALADYVYENIFLKYTMKQWGKQPHEIDPNVTARVPVFVSHDNRYFQDTYQGMPKDGYTKLFERILDHPNIEVWLNTDARKIVDLTGDVVKFEGKDFHGICLLTGQIDELFQMKFGRLPYRTLDFRFETHRVDFFQDCAVVNYTVDQPFTRVTEFKRLTQQHVPGVTTIVKEFSKEYTGSDEIPYYAVTNGESLELHGKYVARAESLPSVYLLGRLAEFKYYNMDGIVRRALEMADQILAESPRGFHSK